MRLKSTRIVWPLVNRAGTALVGSAADELSSPAARIDIEAYCVEYADRIPVRMIVDGRWRNVFLADMEPAVRAGYVAYFARRGVMPTRVTRGPA